MTTRTGWLRERPGQACGSVDAGQPRVDGLRSFGGAKMLLPRADSLSVVD
ncbi:hypothetical protein R4282_03290 [Rhodococcus oxybenzonivorans]|nr:hypothetical protein [Rhodococcus oxybenzonivorans]MDV7352045.1 hypothetical protein [Rhodococcus oxybenzonivorans]